MATTVHVYPSKDGWAVKRDDAQRSSSLFATQKEAISKARSLARNSAVSGQMVVHGKNGAIREHVTYGFPKVQDPPGKRGKKIEKAVGRVVLQRFSSDPHPPRG